MQVWRRVLSRRVRRGRFPDLVEYVCLCVCVSVYKSAWVKLARSIPASPRRSSLMAPLLLTRANTPHHHLRDNSLFLPPFLRPASSTTAALSSLSPSLPPSVLPVLGTQSALVSQAAPRPSSLAADTGVLDWLKVFCLCARRKWCVCVEK